MKRFLFKCLILICFILFMMPTIYQAKKDIDAQLRPLGISSVVELVTHPDRAIKNMFDSIFNSMS